MHEQTCRIRRIGTWPLPDSRSMRSMRRRMSGRGWWMVMMTVTPAPASPAKMSTTLEALLLSSPASQTRPNVATLRSDPYYAVYLWHLTDSQSAYSPLLTATVTAALTANIDRINTMTKWAVSSLPVVGSSRRRQAGEVSSSEAMATRRRSPPDRPRVNASPIRLCATCTKIKTAYLSA